MFSEIPVCGSDDAAAAVRSYLRKACDLILSEIGEDVVSAIALSGSATFGEFTAVETPDNGLFLLSDIDLSVITRSDAKRNAVKSIRPALKKKLGAIDEASIMCSPADIGVYSPGDLRAQVPKMGVVEMRESGKVLWGDAAALMALPDYGPADITQWEAVTLLHNRCLESLSVAGKRESGRQQDTMNLLYAGAKAYLDAGTSLAAFHGRYVPGYRRRLREVIDITHDKYSNGLGGLAAETFLEGMAFWTDFKVDGDLNKIIAMYGAGGSPEGMREAAWQSLRESIEPLTGVWIALTAGTGGAVPDRLVGACKGQLRSEPAAQRLRGWRRLVRAGEVPLSRALSLSRHGSPLFLLRLSAVCLLDQLAKTGPDAPVEKNARDFLDHYFPAVPPQSVGDDAGGWRTLIVNTWSRWTERFWS